MKTKIKSIELTGKLRSAAKRFQYVSFCVALTLICIHNISRAQGSKIQLGVGAGAYVSGSGHGTLYSGFATLSKGKHMFNLGPIIMKRCMHVKGLRLVYSHLLAGRDDNGLGKGLPYEGPELQLRFFSYAQYLHQAGLSYNKTRVETVTNRESQTDWNKVKLNTGEVGSGIELDVKMKYVTLRNYITLATYYHFNYIKGMYHENLQPVITLGVGLTLPNL
jgi:hypothetical protein